MFTRLGSQSIDLWIARTTWHCLYWINGTRVCRALNIRFVAQTWLFPQLIAVITDSMQLISVMYIVRSCPETSPCDHLIVAITGNLQFISAMHIIRSCFKTTSLWPAGYKDGLVAVRSLLQYRSYVCRWPSSVRRRSGELFAVRDVLVLYVVHSRHAANELFQMFGEYFVTWNFFLHKEFGKLE